MTTQSTAARLDLVYGLPLNPNRATALPEHAGNPDHFRGRGCEAVFDKQPDGFVTSGRTNTPGADGRCGRQG
jgi:hypothetical protein